MSQKFTKKDLQGMVVDPGSCYTKWLIERVEGENLYIRDAINQKKFPHTQLMCVTSSEMIKYLEEGVYEFMYHVNKDYYEIY